MIVNFDDEGAPAPPLLADFGSMSSAARVTLAQVEEITSEALALRSAQLGVPVRSDIQVAQNLVLVAPKRALHLTRDDLVKRARDDRLAKMAGNLVDRFDLSGATVLTDDFSAVEYLVAGQLRQ